MQQHIRQQTTAVDYKCLFYGFGNGIAMLSSVLRSDTAVEVNIRIMRAFTKI